MAMASARPFLISLVDCGLQLLLNDYSVHSDGADFAPLPSDSDWSSLLGSCCASEAGSVLGSAAVSEDLSKSLASSPAASFSRGSSLSRVSSLSRHRSSDRADCSSQVMINTVIRDAALSAGAADVKRKSTGFNGAGGSADGSGPVQENTARHWQWR
jgi:hypothetical protein